MARKLPWSSEAVAESSKTQARRASPPTVKKEKPHDISRPITPEPTTQTPRKRFTARSPSTSPIQQPPQLSQTIEPMRPGLHADDRYIIVEDEFESLARQFTAHLHAAEYARLKRIARSAPPKPIPDISPGMPRTTKLNLERQKLLRRQSTGMNEITKRAKAAAARLDDDDSDAGQEDRGGDLWTGTSLAGLMGDNTQAKMSLVGLQRMDSDTRAARGFGRTEEKTERKKGKSVAGIFGGDEDDSVDVDGGIEDDIPFVRREKKKAVEQAGVHVESATVQNRSRDIANEVRSPMSSRKRTLSDVEEHHNHRKPTSTRKANDNLSAPPNPRLQPSTNPTPTKPKPRRTFIDDLDDYSPTESNPSPAVSSKPPPPRTKPTPPASRTSKPDPKKDRKSRLDEVPVFLA